MKIDWQNIENTGDIIFAIGVTGIAFCMIIMVGTTFDPSVTVYPITAAKILPYLIIPLVVGFIIKAFAMVFRR